MVVAEERVERLMVEEPTTTKSEDLPLRVWTKEEVSDAETAVRVETEEVTVLPEESVVVTGTNVSIVVEEAVREAEESGESESEDSPSEVSDGEAEDVGDESSLEGESSVDVGSASVLLGVLSGLALVVGASVVVGLSVVAAVSDVGESDDGSEEAVVSVGVSSEEVVGALSSSAVDVGSLVEVLTPVPTTWRLGRTPSGMSWARIWAKPRKTENMAAVEGEGEGAGRMYPRTRRAVGWERGRGLLVLGGGVSD